MQSGTFFTLLACLCWGLLFVIPVYMEGFQSIEVVIARYIIFGLFSCVLLAVQLIRGGSLPKMRHWVRAALMGLAVNLLYYLALVLASRYSSPAITAIIASGLCPALVALISNKGSRECNPKLLVWPSLLIIVGVVLVNYTTLCEHCVSSTVGEYLFGLGCALIALAGGALSIVLNARFLKRNIVDPALWSTLIGATTLLWVTLVATGHYVLEVNPSLWDMLWYQKSGHEVFWIGGALLGVISGWLGAVLWNIASKRVLISLGGQLLIMETLFGVLMVYAYAGTQPTVLEFTGLLILMLSVIWTTRSILELKRLAKQRFLAL